MNPDPSFFVILGGLAFALALYALPSWIAFRRRHPNRWLILAVNLALGGTGFAWVGCLVWALHAAHRPNASDQSRGGQSGLNLFVNDVSRVMQVLPPAPARFGQLTVTAAAERLEALARLRAGGHLSEAEHARLKAEVLDAVG